MKLKSHIGLTSTDHKADRAVCGACREQRPAGMLVSSSSMLPADISVTSTGSLALPGAVRCTDWSCCAMQRFFLGNILETLTFVEQATANDTLFPVYVIEGVAVQIRCAPLPNVRVAAHHAYSKGASMCRQLASVTLCRMPHLPSQSSPLPLACQGSVAEGG